MMRKKVLRKKGITLVEILLVASIMTFVGLGIYKTFTSGITVWKWIEANRPDGEVLIFFDKVSSDLRNYCDIASSDFNGSSFSVSFLVHNPEYLVVSENAQSALLFQDDAISRIEYVYIPERKEIRRKMYKYGADYVILPHLLTGEKVSLIIKRAFHDRKYLKGLTKKHLKLLGLDESLINKF